MNARKATRRATVNVDAFDRLIEYYGGVVTFADEIRVDRKTVWTWREERNTPAPIVQRMINDLARRHRLSPPYPEADADTFARALARVEVLDEAIEAIRLAPGGTLTGNDAIRILDGLKTRAGAT